MLSIRCRWTVKTPSNLWSSPVPDLPIADIALGCPMKTKLIITARNLDDKLLRQWGYQTKWIRSFVGKPIHKIRIIFNPILSTVWGGRGVMRSSIMMSWCLVAWLNCRRSQDLFNQVNKLPSPVGWLCEYDISLTERCGWGWCSCL